jgi:hypothetical protein
MLSDGANETGDSTICCSLYRSLGASVLCSDAIVVIADEDSDDVFDMTDVDAHLLTESRPQMPTFLESGLPERFVEEDASDSVGEGDGTGGGRLDAVIFEWSARILNGVDDRECTFVDVVDVEMDGRDNLACDLDDVGADEGRRND